MSLLLAAGSAPSGNSGAIATTLTGALGALTGQETFSGAIASTLSGASASLTGLETFSGSVSTTLAGASASLAGSETFSGPISTTLAGVTAALTGSVSGAGTTGSIATTLDGITVALAGSETFSGAISTALDGVGAALTGSVSSGAITGTIATTLDGASAALTGDGGATQGGGYDDDKPKRKKYIVKVDGQLLVFSNPQAAANALERTTPAQVAQKPSKKKAVQVKQPDVKPDEVIDLPQVEEYAQVSGLVEQYNQAYNSQHFEALLALFEQMRDEEEIELLLLG